MTVKSPDFLPTLKSGLTDVIRLARPPLFGTTVSRGSYQRPVVRAPPIGPFGKSSPPESAVWQPWEIIVVLGASRRNGQRPDVEERWTSPAQPGSLVGLAMALPDSWTKQAEGIRDMFQNKTWWTTAAGILATATFVSSVVGGGPTPPTPAVSGHEVPSAGMWSDAPPLPKHWDLWANYCSQKRREHDPVRHYHPLVRMKYALLPHHGHGCGHCAPGTCGMCGEGCHHGGSEPLPYSSPSHSSPNRPESQQGPQPPAPLPPVLQGEATGESHVSTPSPAHTRTNADRVRPLPPVEEPIVVPPTSEPPALPKNPLPKRRVNRPSEHRSSPPASVDVGRYFETD